MLQFIGIVITMFSVMSMQLILVSVMPVISMELGGENLYSWVFSGYMIASLVTIPLFSKLADVYGRRRFYLTSISIFIAGSVIGAFSISMGQLILARLVQGAAAGILTPVTLAMISEMFPPEQRGKMIGYFSLVQLASNILSPLLGEAITNWLNWHWVFYLSIILLAAALLIFFLAAKKPENKSDSSPPQIDVAGGILFGSLSALIVYYFNSFKPDTALDGMLIVCTLLIIVVAVCLIIVERKAKNPILRVNFFRVKILRRSIISAMLSGAVMYGFANMLPILSSIVTDQIPIKASMVLLTFMVGITVGMLLGSRLWSKFTRLPFALWIAMTAAVLGVTLCLHFELFWLLICADIVSGAALGGIMSTVMIHSQNSVGDADRTVLSGFVQLSRYFGAAVGVAVMISLIPNVNTVSSLSEFISAFGVVLGVCSLGVINEWV